MDIDALFQSLQSPDEATRMRAVVRLEQNTDLRAIPALMKLSLHDPSLEVRFLAKKVLNTYRTKIRDGEGDEQPEPAPPPPTPGPATGSAPGVLTPGADEKNCDASRSAKTTAGCGQPSFWPWGPSADRPRFR